MKIGRLGQQLLSDDQYRFINNTIANIVDMTSRQLHSALIAEYPELESISISTVKTSTYSPQVDIEVLHAHKRK